ncbi:DUF3870 domain-containing protein [Irregularibacter muris]|uniref:DUF3870 domain-containing protein n=1 Tax=Irregularibacter muris TaxID=1796619 RepID=A0AAE3HHL5_9FIRM|nr:DUF3870 domain-containing protein [Irregularibacter muris]MCR1899574.1 DUF3870 domain-containing protein [Irregularibacter muris]
MVYIRKYSEDSVYFSTTSKLPSGAPSEQVYHALDIGLIINSKTGVIEDISATLLTEETRDFLKELIIGFNLHETDLEVLLNRLKFRYFGYAQKAICVAIKHINFNYLKYKGEI